MANFTKGPVRTLGAVRKNASTIENVPKFPSLTPTMDKGYIGIMGNAMQVPPPKDVPDKPERVIEKPVVQKRYSGGGNPRKAISSKSAESADQSEKAVVRSDTKSAERQLKEAQNRERQLKNQITQLKETIEKLKKEVETKDEALMELQQQMKNQEAKYKELYELELAHHQETRKSLDTTEKELSHSRAKVDLLEQQLETETKELRELMEKSLEELRTEKDAEIQIREDKLNKLKKQMAEALKGNSWERQQQLDELQKELSRVQDEADNLRFKIKAFHKNNKKGGCANCDSAQSQLNSSQQTIAEKDKIITDLKLLAGKFEQQLLQQDLMLKQYAEQQGQKMFHK